MNWGRRYKILGKLDEHTNELASEFRQVEGLLDKEPHEKTASPQRYLVSSTINRFERAAGSLRSTMKGIKPVVKEIQKASTKAKQRAGKISNLKLELRSRKTLLKRKIKLAKRAKGEDKKVAILEVSIVEKTSKQVGSSLKGLKAKLARSKAELKQSIKDFKDENKAVKGHTKELGKLIKEFKEDVALLKKTNKELAKKVRNKDLNTAMKDLVTWIRKYGSFFGY